MHHNTLEPSGKAELLEVAPLYRDEVKLRPLPTQLATNMYVFIEVNI